MVDWLAVAASGRVRCPRRQQLVELTACMECNWLLDLDRAAGLPALRCAAVSPTTDGREPRPAESHID